MEDELNDKKEERDLACKITVPEEQPKDVVVQEEEEEEQ